MPETTHTSRGVIAMRRAVSPAVGWCRAVRTAWRSLVLLHERPIRAVLTALWLGSIPVIAHAGIWNGGLCTVYQDVLDNELLEVVSLSALVGSIVLWLLDDGRSNIKTHVLRGVLGTLAILNMPLLWAQVFNHGAACTGTL
ncbi:hypothetical protein B0G76_1759 [Paraburkholderia sp. BL23I1N1]|uniref:hypothetical protein n=1 Tax=unclassified Paraburkholderia TaxID=2615204 RepID=UPI000A57DDC7|nr:MULTISPECIES: hypothetical protein [unclassified Paraburkholderia]REE18630.1 hypothetical protein B0G71_1687 [Paraburkholderia sp. BL27I4N3]RKE35644.1 hypothetical protein B0G76_1759 [Paraburkholderia sp. BL23I1N1]TCK94709.1 hypothetical protein B0G74_1303 [Paraburkholderia sp. BL9I2N2]